MILNDKPNCQVSRILMNPHPIFSDRSENDLLISIEKKTQRLLCFDSSFKDFDEPSNFFRSLKE
jgi:hypothetical protein